jgi:hypothetical protein
MREKESPDSLTSDHGNNVIYFLHTYSREGREQAQMNMFVTAKLKDSFNEMAQTTVGMS